MKTTTSSARSFIFATVLLILAPACAAETGGGGTTLPSDVRGTTADFPQGAEPVDLNPADFTVDIDNPYWPMQPGTRWTYREVQPDGTEVEVIVIVTTLTKEIANGITARVIRDTVIEDGDIIEDTFDWYAQDVAGNIWYLGEDTKEYENGVVVTTEGSWEAGVDGAQAGIVLPGEPAAGMTYRQEYYAGEAEDRARILSLDEHVDVPYGSFDGALQTEDSTPLDPDVLEHKYYVTGVGPVLAVDVGAGAGREELVTFEEGP